MDLEVGNEFDDGLNHSGGRNLKLMFDSLENVGLAIRSKLPITEYEDTSLCACFNLVLNGIQLLNSTFWSTRREAGTSGHVKNL